mmetsp:Transcript_31407/g.57703  ORF Transcript_31407/g.57703 Transcript_31407/m.57703 type:complete len:83 (+) Transcript_31407:1389-1637(+)
MCWEPRPVGRSTTNGRHAMRNADWHDAGRHALRNDGADASNEWGHGRAYGWCPRNAATGKIGCDRIRPSEVSGYQLRPHVFL